LPDFNLIKTSTKNHLEILITRPKLDTMKLKLLLTFVIATGALISSSCSNAAGNYPVAKPMIDPETGVAVKDHYVSPFYPHNPIVAKGFKSGQMAGDPSTIKVNLKTGKQDPSTVQIFRLP
jgi:hypothetical protein